MKQFDERQLKIRGEIFQHGFIITMAVLLLNAFLQSDVLRDGGIAWADGFQQNYLMLLLILTGCSLECILRGVYFGKGTQNELFVAIFGTASLLLLAASAAHLAAGQALFADGALTDNGARLISGTMFLSIAVCALIQLRREKRPE